MHCTFATKVWGGDFPKIWAQLGQDENSQRTVISADSKVSSQTILWDLTLFPGLWKLWIERNSKVIKNKSLDAKVIVDSIVWMVKTWASRGKEFVDVSVQEMNRCRASVFQGGQRKKS